MSGRDSETEAPWWRGTVCPTGTYRWKALQWHDRRRAGCIGGMVLQQLITDTNGMRRRWVDVPIVSYAETDDA